MDLQSGRGTWGVVERSFGWWLLIGPWGLLRSSGLGIDCSTCVRGGEDCHPRMTYVLPIA